MHFVYYVYFVFGVKRQNPGAFPQGTDVVNASVGSGIYFINVIGGDADIPGENSRHRGLTGAPATDKEVRMRHLALFHRAL